MQSAAAGHVLVGAVIMTACAAASLGGFVFLEILPDHAPVSAPDAFEAASVSSSAESGVGVPVRLIIPSIDVDAVIEEVGLTADQSLDVPKEAMHAGWYVHGPRPGARGSAVIDGHVDWLYGASGVFKRLKYLVAGDEIVVEDDAGRTVVFVVRAVNIYSSNANAVDVFSSVDGAAHLNLITCSGSWSSSAGQYSERLVVFADAKE